MNLKLTDRGLSES